VLTFTNVIFDVSIGKRLEGVEEFLHLQQGQPKPEVFDFFWVK